MRAWLGGLLLCGALGCAAHADLQAGPNATLRAYSAALTEGRADDAYALLSSEAKRSISLEAFRRMVRENREDVLEIARALARPSSDPVVTAAVVSPGGERLELVYEAGAWRIDGTAIDRYGQSTPRQAIEGFVRAFERKRYDILMRYVPNAEREGTAAPLWGPEADAPQGSAQPEPDPPADAGAPLPAKPALTGGGLTAELLREAWEGEQKEHISQIVQAIKSALPTAQIEQTEDRAAMPYGAGGTVLFVREQGLWKIEDL